MNANVSHVADKQGRAGDHAFEDWFRVRSAIEAENLLINHRQTWHSALQTLITAAFFIIFSALARHDIKSNDEYWIPALIVLFVLSALGIAVSITIHTSIRCASLQMKNLESWWFHKYSKDDQQTYLEDHPYINGIFEKALYKDLNPSSIPLFFGFVWTIAPSILLTFVVIPTSKLLKDNPLPSVVILTLLINLTIFASKRLYNRWFKKHDAPDREHQPT